MKLNRLTTFLLSAAVLLGAASCTKVKRGEYAKGTATIFVDDGFRNLVQEEISVFEFSYPESSIIPFFVSEQDAIDTLMADATQAIIVTQELTEDQKRYIKDKNKRIVKTHCIAVDAVALITNKENSVKDLTMEEIGKILNGEVTKWTQLAGNDTTSIKLVFDNAGSSTVSFLKEKFMKDGRKISDNPNAFAQQNNAQVFDVVKKDKDALGIISVSWLGDDLEKAKDIPIDQRVEDYKNETDTIVPQMTTEVNIVRISNPTEKNDFDPKSYAPYQVYIHSGQYPLFRKVYMISTASKSTVLNSFYTFVTGFAGQKIIMKTGILPYHTNPRVVELVDRK